MAIDDSKLAHPPHPYYPLELEIVGYLANDWHFLTLLAIFASGCFAVFSATYAIAKRMRPQIPTSELLTIMWFVLSGCIHFFFEGYYVYNFRTIAGLQHLFAQLWKEYAYSDSRYLTQDPFVLCMETITAVFWGPLSFLTAYFILTTHPLRHPLQSIVSLGQMYGDILYYATSLVDHYALNISYSRPEAFYFWIYFVGMNAFWIVIPAVLIWNSVKHSERAFRLLQEKEGEKMANGIGKKRA